MLVGTRDEVDEADEEEEDTEAEEEGGGALNTRRWNRGEVGYAMREDASC